MQGCQSSWDSVQVPSTTHGRVDQLRRLPFLAISYMDSIFLWTYYAHNQQLIFD